MPSLTPRFTVLCCENACFTKSSVFSWERRRYKRTYLQKRSRLTESRLVIARAGGGGREVLREFGVSRYTRLDIEWLNNNVP